MCEALSLIEYYRRSSWSTPFNGHAEVAVALPIDTSIRLILLFASRRWFDSGSSWAACTEQNEALNYPADLYLEGSDQHRGWFQSSLLTSVAVNGHAPYRNVLTHGFVLDERVRFSGSHYLNRV